jgi:YHS domain-containing protein/thiol-disulfide isomerase/thioredoxin
MTQQPCLFRRPFQPFGVSPQLCRRVLAVALILAAYAASSVEAASDPPLIDGVNGPSRWLHNYGQGRQLARDLGLPLVVHFHASWCAPCQQMERETLSSRRLVGQLGRQIIGVKIDSDEEPGLVEDFRIDALPCDVVIAPDGLIVERISGYQPQPKYLSMVERTAARFRSERAEAIARLQPPTQPQLPTQPQPAATPQQPATRPNPRPAGPDSRSLANSSGTPRPEFRPLPSEAGPAIRSPIEQPASGQPPVTPAEQTVVAGVSPLVGLDGYCPVHIKSRREWVKGRPEFSTTWQGVAYQFPTEDDLRAFQAAPQKFAPRMLGCDPVQLWVTERAVQGSVEFGAFFNGELFLFVSAESRNQFKVNPSRYIQLRTAFRADDVIGTRLR